MITDRMSINSNLATGVHAYMLAGSKAKYNLG